MNDEKTMGQVIQIDEARIRDHLGEIDLLPNLPSLIRRVCSSFAPDWGVLRTRLV